jgi:hypothetical protein
LDWLEVYLELKKVIEEMIEEDEIKTLMRDINIEVFGATRTARAVSREEPEPEIRGDSEVARMKERMAKRRAAASNREQSIGTYATRLLPNHLLYLRSTYSFTLVAADSVEGAQESVSLCLLSQSLMPI